MVTQGPVPSPLELNKVNVSAKTLKDYGLILVTGWRATDLYLIIQANPQISRSSAAPGNLATNYHIG